ncbi:MAG TPA: 4Fe-4S dicluster domain-containing protein [Pseudomonadales bacterium]|nr:4Fe-4S dicluster domain-containing protein [Pseudomonadales bacterium]MDP6316170.1 4Fe-4S dicluster domain-containing protein [Pseudomonadales bacterium]MDP7315640.1 4Fe-4S dicluster domain-containing protein [Pseudomonadales bacterium]HJP50763.1 4Fe-4S dicluster domain-containing protein [Pseudomonadales bacterium]
MSDTKIPLVDITTRATHENNSVSEWRPADDDVNVDKPSSPSRRKFIKKSAGVTTASLIGTAALVTGSDNVQANTSWAEHFQGNYRLMSDEEKAEAIDRLEKRYSLEYEKEVTVDGTDAQEGVLFGYALNIQKCIGCRRCVKACVEENNQSRGDEQEIEWIRVLKMEKGEFTQEKLNDGYPGDYGIQVGGNAYSAAGVVLEGEHYYEPEAVPEGDSHYMPIACMQCEKPPCVKVCPVRTTYREPDGPVVIDYNWCIGCRMCIGACPYWARRFNWGEPQLPKEEMNPKTHYLGNRPRMKGVVEKCTFCIQRIRHGRYPACVEVCPVGARKFGNLLDPNSEVRRVLDRKRVFRLKAEANTYPKFFYFVD